MRRTLLLATLLLGGCVTPSGIIDVYTPPQADPVAGSQVDVKCPEPADPSARCIADAVAGMVSPQVGRVEQKPNPRRPSPPRVMRR